MDKLKDNETNMKNCFTQSYKPFDFETFSNKYFVGQRKQEYSISPPVLSQSNQFIQSFDSESFIKRFANEVRKDQKK